MYAGHGAVQHSREHESISVHPVGILRVKGHKLVEEDMSHRGHAHRSAGMPGVRIEGCIDLGRCHQSLALVQPRGVTPAEGESGEQGLNCPRTANKRMVLMANQSISP